MTKVCTICGKEIEEGKVCECSKKAKKEVTSEKIDVKEMFLNIWETTKNMFKKPFASLKDYSKESNFYSSLIIFAIVAILSGFIGLLSVNKMMSGFEYDKFEVFIKFFIVALIPVVANVLVYLFVYNVMFKSKVTWKELVSAVAGTMILETIGLIVAFICTYINGYVATIVLLFTLVIYFVQFVTIITHVTNIDKEKNTWAFAIAATITIALSCWISYSIFKDLFVSIFSASLYGMF